MGRGNALKLRPYRCRGYCCDSHPTDNPAGRHVRNTACPRFLQTKAKSTGGVTRAPTTDNADGPVHQVARLHMRIENVHFLEALRDTIDLYFFEQERLRIEFVTGVGRRHS